MRRTKERQAQGTYAVQDLCGFRLIEIHINTHTHTLTLTNIQLHNLNYSHTLVFGEPQLPNELINLC